MALHTGQHLLSRALADVADSATVSSRLGETACTIDLDRDGVSERLVAEAEALVNRVIDDDLPIRAFFPTPDELAALPLRRAPKVTENIRVVAVGEFDVSPCGGTHCTRSAQVGLVRVSGLERYKGKSRVSFAAGRRARQGLWQQADTLRDLGRAFSCGPLDVPAAVDKLRRELADSREALGHARAKVADAIAAELLARGGPAVVVLEDAGVDLLRAVSGRLVARPEQLAFLAARGPDGLAVIVARGPGASLDCGAALKKLAAAGGGRGGGRPDYAEGRLARDADWAALVASLG